MRTGIIRGALLGILLLGFSIPGMALADDDKDDKRGCSNKGTWFGVAAPGDTRLAGFAGTVMGKSEKMGTNTFEFPVFDPSFSNVPDLGLSNIPPFASAVSIGSLRGDWKRVAKNRFAYTFMGFAFDEFGMPVYIAKVSGHVEIINDCQYQYITATMEVFLPGVSPFDGEPDFVIPLGEFYSYRASVDLPY
jgi:hypothetical protein